MWRTHARETRYELTKLARLPGYAVPTLIFPVMFYVLFGIAMAGSRAMSGRDLSTYLLASYGAFGVIGAAFSGFGIVVAMERAQGWLLLKRATPMPPSSYVLAKVVSAMLFGVLILVMITAMGLAFGNVQVDPLRWTVLALALMVGAAPFCALGLAIGFSSGPNSAVAVANLLHLPASFLGGLWVPIEALPPAVKTIALWLPHYHLGQLAHAVMGTARAPQPGANLLALIAWAAIGVAAATYAMRRDEGQLYG